MAGIDLKGDAKIGDNPRGARVINGRLRVRFVTRNAAAAEGYGAVQIAGGEPSKGQAQVINGALRIRTN